MEEMAMVKAKRWKSKNWAGNLGDLASIYILFCRKKSSPQKFPFLWPFAWHNTHQNDKNSTGVLKIDEEARIGGEVVKVP